MMFFQQISLLASLVFILNLSFYSQRDQAIEIINDLCSENFSGRGYVDHGHIKAAKYIHDVFEKYSLKQFNKGTYLQAFKIKVNTFPNDLHLALDNKVLDEGVDYLLDPVSGSAKGTFKLIYIDQKNIADLISKIAVANEATFKKEAVILNSEGVNDVDTLKLFNDLKYLLAKMCPVLWINNNKFTWSIGREELDYPIIELKSFSFNEVNEIHLDISNVYYDSLTTHNVIGYIEGKKRKKYIIVSAHYDHLGKMGEALFPGANDNASGLAMMMSLIDCFSVNQPKNNMVFIAFGAEEAGILGSKHYVENPLFPLDKIKFVLNLDIMGTGDDGITVVNGTKHKKEFKKLSKLNKKHDYLSKIKIRGQAANSDHYWFSLRGIPAFFIYTLGGIKAYHDVYDRAETLPLTEFNDLRELLVKFLSKI